MVGSRECSGAVLALANSSAGKSKTGGEDGEVVAFVDPLLDDDKLNEISEDSDSNTLLLL